MKAITYQSIKTNESHSYASLERDYCLCSLGSHIIYISFKLVAKGTEKFLGPQRWIRQNSWVLQYLLFILKQFSNCRG